MAALNGADLGGRTLTVNEARPREPRPAEAGRSVVAAATASVAAVVAAVLAAAVAVVAVAAANPAGRTRGRFLRTGRLDQIQRSKAAYPDKAGPCSHQWSSLPAPS